MKQVKITCDYRKTFAQDRKEQLQLQAEWEREYKLYFFELPDRNYRVEMESMEEQSFLCLACDADDIVKYLWKFHDISTKKVEIF